MSDPITMPSTTKENVESTPSTPAKGEKTEQDGDTIEEIPADKLPAHLREEESQEEGIENPSTMEQATSWMGSMMDSAKEKTRGLHNRSAKKEAERSSKSAERVAAEVTGATTAVIKTGLSRTLGTLVGAAKGLFSGVSPTSLKRLRMEEPGELSRVGSWTASQEIERNGVPVGLLQFDWENPECQEAFEEVIALTDATETELELPGGSTKSVIAIPVDSEGDGDTDEGQPLGFIVAVNDTADRRVFLFRDE